MYVAICWWQSNDTQIHLICAEFFGLAICQVILWTNANFVPGTFSQLNKLQRNMNQFLKHLSMKCICKCRPFCSGLNVLKLSLMCFPVASGSIVSLPLMVHMLPSMRNLLNSLATIQQGKRSGECPHMMNYQLIPARFGSKDKSVILEHVWRIEFMITSSEIALSWMPQDTFDDKSTVVQVIT